MVLLKYVQDVEPQVMEQFAEHAPAQIVDAMRQTVTNMLGTLPPQFFKAGSRNPCPNPTCTNAASGLF